MPKLVLFGDSWCEGVWSVDQDKLKLTHPGMTLFLKEQGYKVTNLGVGGSSLWQILYRVQLYLFETNNILDKTDVKIIVFQTEADRTYGSAALNVNYNEILNNSENLEDYYFRIFDVFYIKLNEIAERFNIKIYLCGALTDLNIELLTKINNFPNLEILSDSWLKILYPEHVTSLVPLTNNSKFVEEVIALKQYKIADELIDIADKKIIPLQSIIETEYFDKEFCNFHPNQLGHKIMAEYITNFFVNNIGEK